MKPGLSGEVYSSCFILCRDEKPTKYHIGNFLPQSITKNPTNKQKNHPHKNSTKTKRTQTPPAKQQPKTTTMTTTTNQPKNRTTQPIRKPQKTQTQNRNPPAPTTL